jgi:hypothetical protein
MPFQRGATTRFHFRAFHCKQSRCARRFKLLHVGLSADDQQKFAPWHPRNQFDAGNLLSGKIDNFGASFADNRVALVTPETFVDLLQILYTNKQQCERRLLRAPIIRQPLTRVSRPRYAKRWRL